MALVQNWNHWNPTAWDPANLWKELKKKMITEECNCSATFPPETLFRIFKRLSDVENSSDSEYAIFMNETLWEVHEFWF